MVSTLQLEKMFKESKEVREFVEHLKMYLKDEIEFGVSELPSLVMTESVRRFEVAGIIASHTSLRTLLISWGGKVNAPDNNNI